jgi:hypothetical protein
MDPLNDLLHQQRHIVPPSGAARRLEEQVMSELGRLPQKRRRKLAFAGGASLALVLALLVVLAVHRPPLPRPVPSDFVESVVLLDGHVCIWLEEPAAKPPQGSAHE